DGAEIVGAEDAVNVDASARGADISSHIAAHANRTPRMSSPPRPGCARGRPIVEVLPGFSKHLIHHARRQLPGVRILAAWMVAADQNLSAPQPMNDAVSERRPGALSDAAAGPPPPVRGEADCPKTGHD